MSRLHRGSMLVAIGALLVLILLPAAPAAAHETREVGDIVMTVGFGNEPAFSGEPNEVELSLVERRSEDPIVEGVDLSVEVSFGEESTTMELEPAFVVGVFGDPGRYRATFLPSRSGDYTFHFTGTVGDQDIDESFTSGEDTFSPARDPAEVAFPAQDPSNAELADRLERETTRVAEMAEAAESEVAGARTLAVAALVVGGIGLLVGLILGGLALRRARA